ncbi:hypothetical protein JG687_00019232 [Phytophthora cactorum]|uniref:WRKY19-like zinc finger domain-containing protein n=1 Tax=Phytophthora cactorum TaxID=29920 RepID=A0A8T1TMD5_9STRA|nr:hypothetical protein JG687_00019232 [Phytophthora cactorum]
MLRTPFNTVDTSVNVKGSLGFIMNAVDAVSAIEPQWFANPLEAERGDSAKVSAKRKTKVRRTLSYEEKKRSRECKVGGWGSVKCTVEDCERRGKTRGLCWAHGGGTKCSTRSCTKVAVSNGCCWAHGGGKRCAYDGCKKAAYERTHNYCIKHHDQLNDEKNKYYASEYP